MIIINDAYVILKHHKIPLGQLLPYTKEIMGQTWDELHFLKSLVLSRLSAHTHYAYASHNHLLIIAEPHTHLQRFVQATEQGSITHHVI